MATIEIATGDYNEVAGILTASAPQAEELTAITAHMGEFSHTVWLDESEATVWHAWDDLDQPGEWHLQAHPAATAAETWLRETVSSALGNLADPDGSDEYRHHPESVERDLDLLAEFQRVELAALRASAAELGAPAPAVDGMIVGRMQRHRAEISRLTVLRAMHLREVYGQERGAAAAAARALRISHEAARRALVADEQYADRARAAAQRQRQ